MLITSRRRWRLEGDWATGDQEIPNPIEIWVEIGGWHQTESEGEFDLSCFSAVSAVDLAPKMN